MHDAFRALHAETADVLATLAREVGSGLLSPTEFGDRMADALEDAHTAAVVIGRHHAGDTAPVEADDRTFGAEVVDGEAEFLHAFVGDLKEGRYMDAEGAVNAAAIERRANWYADRITGTANEAWTLALPAETTHVYWILGQPQESHCEDCPRLALGSPYLVGELPTVPGRAETECRLNCLCALRTGNGQHGFSIPN